MRLLHYVERAVVVRDTAVNIDVACTHGMFERMTDSNLIPVDIGSKLRDWHRFMACPGRQLPAHPVANLQIILLTMAMFTIRQHQQQQLVQLACNSA